MYRICVSWKSNKEIAANGKFTVTSISCDLFWKMSLLGTINTALTDVDATQKTSLSSVCNIKQYGSRSVNIRGLISKFITHIKIRHLTSFEGTHWKKLQTTDQKWHQKTPKIFNNCMDGLHGLILAQCKLIFSQINKLFLTLNKTISVTKLSAKWQRAMNLDAVPSTDF